MRTSIDLEVSDMEELFKEETNVLSFIRKLVEMAEKGLDSARNEYDFKRNINSIRGGADVDVYYATVDDCIAKTRTWANKLVAENKKLKKELVELYGNP